MIRHRHYFRWIVLLFALALPLGCNSRSPNAAVETYEGHDIDPQKFDRDPAAQSAFVSKVEPKGLRLTLSASPALKRDEFGVRLNVENIGDKPVDWDKEFVGGLEWHVALSDGQKFLPRQKIVVNLTKVVMRNIAKPDLMADPKTNPLVVDRFDRLEPRQSMMREVSLQSLGEEGVYVFENEKVSRLNFANFKLAPAAKVVRVHVTYLPNHGTLRAVHKGDKLLKGSKTDSNVLEIVLK